MLEDRYTVHCEQCHWNLKQIALILAKPCFREEKQTKGNFLDQAIVEKFINLVLLIKKML